VETADQFRQPVEIDNLAQVEHGRQHARGFAHQPISRENRPR
jgi:hypothetical protein